MRESVRERAKEWASGWAGTGMWMKGLVTGSGGEIGRGEREREIRGNGGREQDPASCGMSPAPAGRERAAITPAML